MSTSCVSPRDLLHHPLWRAEDLGRNLPDHPHATSVALPLWQHVIGYEENDPGVVGAMNCGYPRFVLHPVVARLFAGCRERFGRAGEDAFVFPSLASALRCKDYIGEKSGALARVAPLGINDLHGVVFPSAALEAAKKYWQHFGEIVSSRQAEATLAGRGPSGAPGAKTVLMERIAGLVSCAPGDAYLYPSGMAALSGILRMVQAARPRLKSVQLGFPYVDLLKIQSVTGPGVHFFPHITEESLASIAGLLQMEKLSAVVCELPGNPLLRSVDIPKLSRMLRAQGVPLIVDDTAATFYNVDLLPHVDALVSSLTKSFSGAGDVMAGSVVLNAQSPLYDLLKGRQEALYEDIFWEEDAAALEINSRDFAARTRRLNETTEALCDYLAGHAQVDKLYYPKYETPENYLKVMRPGGGYSCLFSFLLKDPAPRSPVFYDHLRVCKGPSLGLNFTLCCPYILLAHYNELEWAEANGLSRHLIRVSVGLEDLADLKTRFDEAFAAL